MVKLFLHLDECSILDAVEQDNLPLHILDDPEQKIDPLTFSAYLRVKGKKRVQDFLRFLTHLKACPAMLLKQGDHHANTADVGKGKVEEKAVVQVESFLHQIFEGIGRLLSVHDVVLDGSGIHKYIKLTPKAVYCLMTDNPILNHPDAFQRHDFIRTALMALLKAGLAG